MNNTTSASDNAHASAGAETEAQRVGPRPKSTRKIEIHDVGTPDKLQTLTAQLAAQSAKLERALQLLRKVEWRGSDEYDYEASCACCPECYGWIPEVSVRDVDYQKKFAKKYAKTIGHAIDCALAAILSESGGGE